jgi:hypothetical protein
LLRHGAQFLIQQVATEINAVTRKLLHCLDEFEDLDHPVPTRPLELPVAMQRCLACLKNPPSI